MKIQKGDKAISIQLPSIDGTTFDTTSLKGKPYMLCFFRFATCPFCNLRMHELVKRYDELEGKLNIVAIFDSPLQHLTRHASGHHAPFPILADATNKYYKKYHIKKSTIGMIKGMMLRLPTMIKGMLKGYIPLPFAIKGSMITMPAEFLIDKDGLIQLAYYGKDEGDHLDFEIVKQFVTDMPKYPSPR